MRNPIIWPVLAVALLGGCAGTQAEPAAPEQLTVQVLQTLPHDPSAFTEGLEFSGT
ncbi:MAG: glutaminyl-peptide cyclotransferase, partial [Actinomycetes bacterium]